MGLFDFNQASTSRKLYSHSNHADGLEAPRNSLDLPIETSQGYHAKHKNIPHSYQVKTHSTTNFYPSGAPMKLLIDREMSKETEANRNVPSVVARLMGMDMLPSDIRPMNHAKESKNDNPRNGFTGKEKIQNDSTHNNLLNLEPSNNPNRDLFSTRNRQELDRFSNTKLTKPQPREHPQEQQLQKFKKEFEAWQASKVWERSRIVELDNNSRQWKNNRTLAQESLNFEKMALYANAKRNATNAKPGENKSQPKEGTLQGRASKMFQQNTQETRSLRNGGRSGEFDQFYLMNYEDQDQLGRSSLPTRIVILKPRPERDNEIEESQVGSAELVDDGNSIEDFLEEVKERLRFGIQGNSRKDVMITRSGVEGLRRSEIPTDPKEIARQIAKQVRERVTRDLGMSLLRSESTRSHRSEFNFERPGSPEFIKRDTRKILTESLRNVLKNETKIDMPKIRNYRSRNLTLDNERNRSKQVNISRNEKVVCNSKNIDDELVTKNSSFRHEKKNNGRYDSVDVSPRNLVRSFSAPVSGTSFGKLLLEDQHVLTGVHIRRKHEETENVSVEVRKTRKDRFSFRGKVSNLRYSLTLRGKLFGKKIKSVEETEVTSESAPSVEMNFGAAQENSTEVPPSPASVCSSTQEELCRPGDHSSPVSTLDVPFNEELPIPEVFREINYNLQVLRKHLNQLESDESGGLAEAECLEAEVVYLEGEAEVYVNNVLIAAGLYESASKCAFSPTSPIGDWVFEEVEEAYRRKDRESEGVVRNSSESNTEHRLLFDLVNEALSCILGPFFSRAGYKRSVLNPTIAPGEKKLLDDVWGMIRMYVRRPVDRYETLDNIVAIDMGMDPWKGMMLDEIDVISKDLEMTILGQLIEEFVRDVYC